MPWPIEASFIKKNVFDLRHTFYAALSAALTVFSFPNFNHAGLAWIALIPLIAAVHDASPHDAFLFGWRTGTLAYAGLLYWLIPTFQAAHVSVLLAITCLFLLSAYLGLFWGAWSWSLTRCRQPFFAAAVWVALEFLRTVLFSGFPWVLFGESQVRHLVLIQISSLTGIYGVSFLVVLVNMAIAVGWSNLRERKRRGFFVLSTIVLLISVECYGVLRLYQGERRPPAQVRVALLQGSVDQYKKWDEAYVEDIKHTYENLTADAARTHPDLIVWPETSVPGYLLQDPPLHTWLLELIQRSGTTHLVGAPAMEGTSAFNAAFLISGQGLVEGGYAKKHLVPFGEVVPMASTLGRWIHVLNALGGFTAGHWPPVLSHGELHLGVNICYEAIFPNLVRQSAAEGANVLVNITNDGWYMKTAAPYQHLTPNIFRAVENARWLIRADNTGVSAIIDPYGRIVAQSSIYVPTIVTGTIEPRTDRTPYTRVGDIFAWLCTLVALMVWTRESHA